MKFNLVNELWVLEGLLIQRRVLLCGLCGQPFEVWRKGTICTLWSENGHYSSLGPIFRHDVLVIAILNSKR